MSTSSTNTIGKYQIIREIARSNDIVYEANDPSINRRIALKELSIPPDVQGAQRRERVERFWREGKAAGRLSHPNIVTIFEVGKDGERHYIAMEYLEGQTLRDVLQTGGALPIKDAVSYTLQLCDALAYAHQHGVIHRDVKPENVQILPGGHVKLTDFGIARLMGETGITQDGQVFGTPSYMSPEQVAGRELDTRSDLFPLGVMLYEMVTGKKPFTGDSIVTITYNIMNMETPIPPGAPPYIVNVIRKAMAKDPNMRYSTADEMAEDLREERAGDQFMPDPMSHSSIPSPFGGAAQPQSQMPGSSFPSPFPSPFPGPQQHPQSQQGQQPVMTPYGTPMPSPGAGSSSDPFAHPSQNSSVHMPPAPPKPILNAETRNFMGVFFLVLGVAGLLVFLIWAGTVAYSSYEVAQTSTAAAQYYEQGLKLYDKKDIPGALDQWQNAIRVSPKSKGAQSAREKIYSVSVGLARDYYLARNTTDLQTEAQRLIEAEPKRPEGHFYMAGAYHLSGKIDEAKKEYASAVVCGGNDEYAQQARKNVTSIYMNEGDQLAAAGRNSEAIAAYENAKKYGDADTLQQAEEKISRLR